MTPNSELAFEDFVGAPESLWRVVSFRSWNERKVRHTNWFDTKEAAEEHAAYIRDGRGEVIGIYEYKQQATP